MKVAESKSLQDLLDLRVAVFLLVVGYHVVIDRAINAQASWRALVVIKLHGCASPQSREHSPGLLLIEGNLGPIFDQFVCPVRKALRRLEKRARVTERRGDQRFSERLDERLVTPLLLRPILCRGREDRDRESCQCMNPPWLAWTTGGKRHAAQRVVWLGLSSSWQAGQSYRAKSGQARPTDRRRLPLT